MVLATYLVKGRKIIMNAHYQSSFLGTFLVLVSINVPLSVVAEEKSAKRQIEEVTVTAVRRETTVSDTSIAITALDQGFIENMGMQGPDDLVEFVPATTRTDWDIKIRGIGRNFRHLGGDPGVATFYNGVYSTDFGIAATESALYDVERIEVLRGPQGTLYGRNAIGGALNYITRQPTYDWEAEFSVVLGEYNTQEYKGILSGPLIDGTLAFRLNFIKAVRDETMEGIAGTPDFDDNDDENHVLSLRWDPTDNIRVNVRLNNRNEDQNGNFGRSAPVMTEEGPWGYRVPRDNGFFAYGLRPVDEVEFNRLNGLGEDAFQFVHPSTGASHYGARVRPGVDAAPWPYSPNPAYLDPTVLLYDGGDEDDPNRITYKNGYDYQGFDQRAITLDASWDITETMQVKYLYGYQNFDYMFDRDNDYSASTFSDVRDTDRESVYSWSHELQLFWESGDNIIGTSGIYMFYEDRMQWYSVRNSAYHGYLTNVPDYGQLAPAAWLTPCTSEDKVAVPFGTGNTYGFQCGDAGVAHQRDNDNGAAYEGKNMVENTAYAAYTQIDWQLNDQWMVTLGLRWAEDKRLGVERRFVYWEESVETFWLDGDSAALVADIVAANEGMTTLGAFNVAMGNAVPSGDPNNPITPVCAPLAATCANPIRLGGLPMTERRHLRVRDSWDDVTWRVNFNWTPNDDTLVYFGATTGVRSGGWALGEGSTAIGNELMPFDSEELLAYEVGYKGELFDNTMQVNVALYYYDYEGYQDESQIIDPTRDTNVNIITNVPNIINQGFEIDALWLATDRLTIGGNYGYTISEYDGTYLLTNYDDPRYPRAVFGSGIDDPLYTRNIDGEQIQGIPKHKGVVWAAYAWPTRLGDFTVHAMYAVTGEFFNHEFSRPFDEVPSRDRMDVRLTWASADDRWQVSAFVDNVFDDTALRDISQGGPGSNFRVSGIALFPRYMGIGATYAFDM
jgi:iron complex outermembrane receptor protein